GRIPNPQLKLQFSKQALEPTGMPAGFHAYAHLLTLLFQLSVKLFSFFAVNQASFAQFPRFAIYPCNLLEARMIITAYNQHVRLLSSALWLFAPPKFTRAWEPTLFRKSLRSVENPPLTEIAGSAATWFMGVMVTS